MARTTTKRKATAKPKAKSSAKRAAKGNGKINALNLLKADHEAVNELFEKFQKARSDRKEQIAQKICDELTVHALIEEEIFYPAIRGEIEDSELVAEARVEHGSLKKLIAEIEEHDGDEEEFEAKVKVLCEYVKHHVKEEQGEMFKEVRRTDVDLYELGARLAERKQALMAEMG